MVLLFYVDDCLMFGNYKDNIDYVYASLHEDLKIEDNGEHTQNFRINLDCRPDGSINLSQTYLTQSICDMIPGMDKSTNKLAT